jgi:hypothetical protein
MASFRLHSFLNELRTTSEHGYSCDQPVTVTGASLRQAFEELTTASRRPADMALYMSLMTRRAVRLAGRGDAEAQHVLADMLAAGWA